MGFFAQFTRTFSARKARVTTPACCMIYRLYRYMVYMDENGDAEGNYTLIALDNRPTKGHGLYPIAYFVGKENGTNLPVRR